MHNNSLNSEEIACPVDLSVPDNSAYAKGRSKFVQALWYFIGSPVVRANMLPFSSLKCAVLRLFGAKLGRRIYLKAGVRVKFPWYLAIGDYSWIGEDVWIDNLTDVRIGANTCISQGAYLCTGNHDWSTHNMKLFRRPIEVEDGSWVGARATLCPGVTVRTCSIVTVGSVVTTIIPPFQVWGGNPARYLRDRGSISGSNPPASKTN